MPDNEDDAADVPAVVVIDTDGAEDSTPDAEAEGGDASITIVNDTVDDAPAITPTDLDMVERIVNLERDVAELRTAVFEAQITAEVAEAEAEAALEISDDLAVQDEEIIEAVDETIEDVIDDAEVVDDDGEPTDDAIEADVEPASARVHWLFRPARDFIKR